MLIKPKIRGFICTTAHPDGCATNVQQQIEFVRGQDAPTRPCKSALILGASTGYGLSSRICASYLGGAGTLGVFFEKPPTERKCASAGWYNSVAFQEVARRDGLYAESINGDAFSNETKQQTIDRITSKMGKVDLVVYSLASPRRSHPDTGEVFKSVLKPIGASYTNKSLDTDKGIVNEVTIDEADEKEISDTVQVMGGDDWRMWLSALQDAGVLEEGVTTVAYSYIGPELTWPIYRDGTIGRAKANLESARREIASQLGPLDGRAFVSVNKAVVTQASSAIPVVPLYISLLFKEMKEKGVHEGCTEQIYRLFKDHLFVSGEPQLDSAGRIRLDDLEMREDVQETVARRWTEVDSENLRDLADFDGYKAEFFKLFGFGLEEIDYESESDPVRELN